MELVASTNSKVFFGAEMSSSPSEYSPNESLKYKSFPLNQYSQHDACCANWTIFGMIFALIGLSVSSVSIAAWTVLNINCNDYNTDQCSKQYLSKSSIIALQFFSMFGLCASLSIVWWVVILFRHRCKPSKRLYSTGKALQWIHNLFILCLWISSLMVYSGLLALRRNCRNYLYLNKDCAENIGSIIDMTVTPTILILGSIGFHIMCYIGDIDGFITEMASICTSS